MRNGVQRLAHFICFAGLLLIGYAPLEAFGEEAFVQRAQNLIQEGRVLAAEEILISGLDSPSPCGSANALLAVYRANAHLQPESALLDRINDLQVENGCADDHAISTFKRRMHRQIQSATSEEESYRACLRYLMAYRPAELKAIDSSGSDGDRVAAWAISEALASENPTYIRITSAGRERAERYVLSTEEWESWCDASGILALRLPDEAEDQWEDTLLVELSYGAVGGPDLVEEHGRLLKVPLQAEEYLYESGAPMKKRLATLLTAAGNFPLLAAKQLNRLASEAKRMAHDNPREVLEQIPKTMINRTPKELSEIIATFEEVRMTANAVLLLNEETRLRHDEAPLHQRIEILVEVTEVYPAWVESHWERLIDDIADQVFHEPMEVRKLLLEERLSRIPPAATDFRHRLSEIKEKADIQLDFIESMPIVYEEMPEEEARSASEMLQRSLESMKIAPSLQALAENRIKDLNQQATLKMQEKRELAEAEREMRAREEARRQEEQERERQLRDLRRYVDVRSLISVNERSSVELRVIYNNASFFSIDGFRGELTLSTQFEEEIARLMVESGPIDPESQRTERYVIDTKSASSARITSLWGRNISVPTEEDARTLVEAISTHQNLVFSFDCSQLRGANRTYGSSRLPREWPDPITLIALAVGILLVALVGAFLLMRKPAEKFEAHSAPTTEISPEPENDSKNE